MGKFHAFLFLLIASFSLFGQETNNSVPIEMPAEDKILVYSSMPPDITAQVIKPFTDYIKTEANLDVTIPRGECEAYDKFQAGAEGLVLPTFPLWKKFTDKGYTRLVETSQPFEMVVISKKPFSGLEDLIGQRVAADSHYTSLYASIIEQHAPGVWDKTIFVDGTTPNYSHLRLLSGEADFALLGKTLWMLTTESIRKKMHTSLFIAETPKMLIMAHPLLSEERKHQYQNILLAAKENSEMEQWMERVTIGSFKSPSPTVDDLIKTLPNTNPYDNCWGNDSTNNAEKNE